MELKIVDCSADEAADLYESDLVLIRPDQVVAWRKQARSEVNPETVLARVMGGEAHPTAIANV
jgi:hypothetical protein